ncbi:hypothetical protein [Trueperella sp. LYQ143]|uniref:hypothetical protein n=1 Tax=unclassified Trueperella TaxID=2630174 RepID=UPI0039832D83
MNISVCPYYFTTQPQRMTDFLRAIGLSPVRTSGEEYTVLRGKAGSVAVHGASGADFGHPGEAHLVLLVDDAQTYAQEMCARGVEIEVWDEAWGKQAGIIDPSGGGIWINEWCHDLYGYTDQENESPSNESSSVEVMMVRYSVDFSADRKFFEQLGFHSAPGADSWWEQMSASDSSGWIGLHHGDAGQLVVREEAANPVGGAVPLVHLSFQTTQPLAEVARRLTQAGYPAQVVTDTAATKVHVHDPDGHHVEIHPAEER